MKDYSFITNSHPAYIEGLYQDFVKNPEAVDPEFRKFFEGFDFAVTQGKAAPVNGSVSANGSANGTPAASSKAFTTADGMDWKKELGAYRLILGYRNKGHLLAKTNPIRPRKDRGANLGLEFYGFTEEDMDRDFFAGNLIGLGTASLRKILDHLQKTYAGHVGIEFKYISDQKKVDWLTNEMEKNFLNPLPLEKKRRILEKLNQGVMFESFLHKKYIGQKRFSLEGGEATIPALDAIINTAAAYNVQEVVIGMAHRGRLNVLANIMGKTYEQIFSEFEGTAKMDQTMGSGDVKYHMGYGSEVQTTENKTVHLKLMPNPSHLEAVDPVVVGFARAKADVLYESVCHKILPILIHGDASVAGQGIVYEVLQMSKLKGYYTGGTMHFVINNQIGFTTDFDDARSSDYATSLAATVQAPVLHVNGDDAEAVVKCAEIATRYRQEFHSDVFVDLVCYRRHGHNEGDDPKFTQPHLYGLIDQHPNPREVYTQFLIENGEADAKELAKEMEKKFVDDLQERLDEVKQHPLPYTYQKPDLWWQSLRKAAGSDFDHSPVTAISEENFKKIFDSIMTWPETFKPLRKIEKLLQDKVKLFNEEGKVDWATGELLAYGSLLLDGHDVRMSGQDVQRGTFSHRHAVLRDENDEQYNRLSRLPDAKAQFRIYNSLLSEYAVLGFEYGYALANPNALVLWEAQFGDFSNGAQTIIDQFITAAEQKWQRMNGVTLLLPHGYEGQGPEHSSARMERFLQMCAEWNIVVTDITTTANLFHAFRRQLAWPFRKPLVNFAPKANLRYPGTYSKMEDFTTGGFKEVMDDPFVDGAEQVKKVLFCSGKIYFDLAERQQKDNRKDVAVIRLEQLYPLPIQQLEALYKKYSQAVTWFWVQEEPLNMGAASFLQMNLKSINYGVISRQPSAATATGYSKVHAQEQAEIIDTAFSI
jgi:2-oxoglutarate dehydrogenase E1 component